MRRIIILILDDRINHENVPLRQDRGDALPRGKAYACITIITIIILMVCPFGRTTRMHCLGAQLIH